MPEQLPGERLLSLRAAVVRRERGHVPGHAETRMLADAARPLIEEIDRLRGALTVVVEIAGEMHDPTHPEGKCWSGCVGCRIEAAARPVLKEAAG